MKSFSLALALAAGGLPLVMSVRMANGIDTFDNPAQQAAGTSPSTSPVDGTAGGALNYTGFGYLNTNGTGARPNSNPVCITAGPNTEPQFGQPGWFPMNSSVSMFDQIAIGYACLKYDGTNQAQNPNTQPVGCTIVLYGVVCATNETVVQPLPYFPPNATANGASNGTNFAYATFPQNTFNKLCAVYAGVTEHYISRENLTMCFDNNTYRYYTNN